MQDAPGVEDGGVGCYEAVGEREREHVEVAEADDEVVALGGAAHEFGHLPGLGGAVAEVGVVGFLFVGRVQVGGEDFGDGVRGGAEPDSGTCDALADEPVASEEGGGSAVEGVADHAAFFDGPFG